MCAGFGEASGQEGPLDVVAGQGQGLFVGVGRILPLPALAQEVSAGGAEVAVGGQGRIGEQWR